MSSVIPASMTTWRPPRSRTWRTRATSQPARATSARPGSIARRLGRRSAGTASSRAGSSRAKRSGAGPDSSSGRTGNPPPTSSVSKSVEPAAEQPDDRETAPDGIPPGVDRAQLRPDVQVDAARPDGTGGMRADPLDEPGRLGLGHPELRPSVTDREARDGLGRDVGVEPDEDVEGRPVAAAEPGAPRHPGHDLRLVGRFEGDPQERGAGRRRPDRRPQVRIGLADALERDPPVGHAGATGDRPLAARDDVGTEPARGDLGDDRRDVVGLDRVLAQPRVGERVADRGRGPIERGEVGHVDRRAVCSARAPERIGDGRQAERRAISRRRRPVAPFRGSVATPRRGGQAGRRC